MTADRTPQAPAPPDVAVDSFAAAGMHAWHWDVASGRVTWSPGVDALFGIPEGRSIESFDGYLSALTAEDRALVEAAIERTMRGEANDYYVEHRIVRADGVERWVAGQGRLCRDERGRPLRMEGVVWDITARKHSEASVARLRRLWSVVREINRSILRGTTEADLFAHACRIVVEVGLIPFAWVGLVSPEGDRVVPAACSGVRSDYLDGLVIEVADTPRGRGPAGTAIREGRPQVINDIATDGDFAPWRERAAVRGFRSCGAFPLRRGDQVVGVLLVYADRAGFFDEEELDLLVGLATDLSEVLGREQRRRAAEDAMRASEERYRAVFEQAFEGIFLVDGGHAIHDANESACKMLGYTRDELLRLRAEDVVHPADLADVPIRFEVIPPGGVILSERRFVRKDRSVIQAELTTKALLDGNFQVVVRDVTERKQVQAQLLLADRLSSLGRLASGVAHEINNPLAYLTLNLSMLSTFLAKSPPAADPAPAEQARQVLESAREGADRVRQIVSTLTSFGRGDEERIGAVDVNAIIDSAVEIAGMHLRHRARVITEYQADCSAKANGFRLSQVFVNLLVNAGDALIDGNPANEVRVRTYKASDGRVVAEVEDNGVGIPRAALPRIFDPFFTTKEVGRGMGLGLSVCHAIVSSFGGEIGCVSAPGEKTVFRVVLEPATISTQPAPSLVAPIASTVRGRVLVVDDDARVAAAMARALEDHDVSVAAGGREAIARCRVESFDCILCDVIMPELSGLDVLDALRREGRGLDRRVVLMTGGALTEPIRAALALSSNRILHKPIELDELRTTVASAIDDARAAPASVER